MRTLRGIWDGIRSALGKKPKPAPEPRQLYDGMGAPISNPAPDDDA